jgi:hypothetical protein
MVSASLGETSGAAFCIFCIQLSVLLELQFSTLLERLEMVVE